MFQLMIVIRYALILISPFLFSLQSALRAVAVQQMFATPDTDLEVRNSQTSSCLQSLFRIFNGRIMMCRIYVR